MATHSATGADARTPGALARATRRLATETKQAFKTTEFWAMVALVVAILIAGNAIEAAEGGPDIFAADKVWLYITILGSAYMITRGLAKSGSQEPFWSDGTNQSGPTALRAASTASHVALQQAAEQADVDPPRSVAEKSSASKDDVERGRC
jgi:hypothetical protein